MSDTNTVTETPAPVRRQVRRKPVRTQRVQMSRDDVKHAADRAAAGPGQRWKLKRRPNWESEDFVGVGLDTVSRINIPDDKVLELARDGWSLQWCTRSIRGQETPELLAQMERGGWTPVFQDEFDGLLNGMFMPKNKLDTPIIVDDCILCVRPAIIQQKAERAQRRDAMLPLQIAEEQIGHGIPGVTGATAPGVRNSIKKTIERVEIPD